MPLSIHSLARLGRRWRPLRVDVRVSAGLPGLTIVGATIGATRSSTGHLRDAYDASGLRWPRLNMIVRTAASGPPDDLEDIEFAVAVALILETDPLQQRDRSNDLIAAWGPLPQSDSAAGSATTSSLLSVGPSRGAGSRPHAVRVVVSLADVHSLVHMTNGPP